MRDEEARSMSEARVTASSASPAAMVIAIRIGGQGMLEGDASARIGAFIAAAPGEL
jgi:hypothetical protein